MLNKFEHLSNGITVVHAKLGKKNSGSTAKVYIDSEDFEKVNTATTEFWSLWGAKDKPSVVANINGKYTKMSRIIKNIENKPNYLAILANKNPLDLRSDNIIVGTKEEISKESFKANLLNIAKSIGEVSEINLANLENSSESEQEDNLFLSIEKNIFTEQFSITFNNEKFILPNCKDEDINIFADIFKKLKVNII